ncbi:PEP-CTERM sorting domain-containing protein [Thalassotalea euphylliae]|uniref:PEP-CTERM sorting domain-containing protein n=1 Tax=Thalassotalea euphylliae TaxID=1655234 RepID=UPI00362E3D7D
MKNNLLKGIVVGLSLFICGIANSSILLSEVSENAYITIDGYDIAWANPCGLGPSSCDPLDLSYQSQFGWRAMDSVLFNQLGITPWDFVFEGANVDYFTGNNLDESTGARVANLSGSLPNGNVAVAAPWFSNNYTHIDWGNGLDGYWSFSDNFAVGYYDTLVVRESLTVPEPSTVIMIAMGIFVLSTRQFRNAK